MPDQVVVNPVPRRPPIEVDSLVGDLADGGEPETRLDNSRLRSTTFDRVRIGRILPDEPDTVVIGITRLLVPPTSIQVTNISGSEPVSSLRSTTSALVKSGRARIQIDLSLVFPTVEAMNNELRELVAQFRLSPFLPLRSTYVSNLLVSTALPGAPDQTDSVSQQEQIQSIRNRMTRTSKELAGDLDTLFSLLKPTGTEADEARKALFGDRTGGDTAIGILHALDGLASHGQDKTVDEEFNKTIGSWLQTVASLQKLRNLTSVIQKGRNNGWFTDHLLDVFGRVLNSYAQIDADHLALSVLLTVPTSNTGTQSRHETGPVVPVVLHSLSVSTIEGYPDSVMARLSLMYFNYRPYSRFFEYRDEQGRPVADIRDSTPFREYLASVLESPPLFGDTGTVRRQFRVISPSYRGQLGFRYPTTTLRQAPATSADIRKKDYVEIDQSGSKHFAGKFTTPLIRDGDIGYVNEYRDWLIPPNDRNIVVESVQMSLANRIAVQPILGSIYPTAQYIGGMNANITIGLCVQGVDRREHDQAMNQILAMKREVERVCVLYGPRARRDSKIFVSNDLINLIGVQAVQLNDVVVETDGPFKSKVLLALTEYTASQSVRENIRKEGDSGLADQFRTVVQWATPKTVAGAGLQAWLVFLQTGVTSDAQAMALTQFVYPESVEALNLRSLQGTLGSVSDRRRSSFELQSAARRLAEEAVSTSDQEYRLAVRKLAALLPARDTNINNIIPELRRLAEEIESSTLAIRNATVGGPSVRNQLERRAELSFLIRQLLSERRTTIRDLDVRDTLLELQRVLREDLLPSDVPSNLRNLAIDQVLDVRAGVVSRKLVAAAILKRPDLVNKIAPATGAVSISARSELIDRYAGFLITRSAGVSAEGLLGRDDLIQTLVQQFNLPARCDDHGILDAMVEVVQEMSVGSVTLPAEFAPLMPEMFRPSRNELQALFAGIYVLKNRFPDLAAILNQKAPKGQTYPDLYLPSYSEVYRGLISRLKEDGKLQEGVGLNSQTAEVQEVFRHVIPTYTDLGIPPPAGVERSAFARELEDQVEPGFFWYHERTLGVEQRPSNTNATSTGANPETAGRAISEERYRRAATQAVQATAVVDLESARRAAKVASESFEAALQTFRDDAWSMSRAFPTFKLYFVEPKSLALNLVDDLYGYNSVLSIKLHRHKFYPDTLEIALLNVSGNLDEQALPEEQLEKDIRGLSRQANVQGLLSRSRAGEVLAQLRSEVASVTRRGTRDPITGKQSSLDSLFLREGTMVVLKMGYSSKAEELETVFTGQVAELQRGDVIQIVAQSYGVELTLPCHQKEAQGAVNAIGLALQKDAAVHFGAAVAEALLIATSPARRVNLELQNVTDPLLLNTRRLDNVYLSNDTAGGQNTWAVPGVVGLELIQEVVRYFPGCVAGVRPYDNHATLFVGLPHQTYRYTDEGIEYELMQKSELAAANKGYRQTYRSRTVARDVLAGLVRELLVGFKSSPDFVVWKDGAFENFLSATFALIPGTQTEIKNGLDYNQYLDILFRHLGREGTIQVLAQLLDEIDEFGETGSRVRLDPNVRDDFRFVGTDAARNPGAASTGEEYGFRFDQLAGRLATEGGRAAEGIANTVDRFGHLVGDLGRRLFGGEARTYRSKAFDLGTVFTNLGDFETLLRKLLGPLTATEREIFETILANGTGAPLSAQGFGIEEWDSKAKKIARFANALREFIRQFANWLQQGATGVPERVKSIIDQARLVDDEKARPAVGRKPFRSYHWVDSDRHIMKNNIRPSTDRMANEVQVRYPNSGVRVEGDEAQGALQVAGSQDWKLEVVPYHQGLREWDIKSTVVAEMNAKNQQRARLVGTSTLADAIAGMYVGDLVIQGNERIQPFDVVWMFDFYNMVFGPVEVEAVTHVLLSDTGFASIIMPRALTFSSPTDFALDEKQCLGQSELLISYVGSVNVKAPDRLLRIESDNTRSTAEKADQARAASIRLVPLTSNGRPWVAGLRGLDPNWRVLTVDGRWDFWDKGAAAIVRERIYGGTGR